MAYLEFFFILKWISTNWDGYTVDYIFKNIIEWKSEGKKKKRLRSDCGKPIYL